MNGADPDDTALARPGSLAGGDGGHLDFPVALALAWFVLPPRPRLTWQAKEHRDFVRFSPDGRALVTRDKDVETLRDAATLRALAEIITRRWTEEPTFSPDGRDLFAELPSQRHRPVPTQDLTIWDVATGRVRAVFPYIGEGGAAPNFTVSADGTTLAFLDLSARLPMQVKTSEMTIDHHRVKSSYNASEAPTRVKAWDLNNGSELADLPGGSPLALSPDGRRLAAAHALARSRKPALRVPELTVWDVATRQPWLTITFEDQTHPGGLAFSPDGKLLAVCCYRDVMLWDLAVRRRLPVTGEWDDRSTPTFTPDGRLFHPSGPPRTRERVIPRKPIVYWDLSETPPKRRELPLGHVTSSRDGSTSVVLRGRDEGQDPQTTTVYDLRSGQVRAEFVEPSVAWALLSPDGRRLALRVYRYRPPAQPSNAVRWLQDHAPRLFPPDYGGSNEAVKVLDVASGETLADITLPKLSRSQVEMTWAPDGRTLALAYPEAPRETVPGFDVTTLPSTVALWDVPPRRPWATILGSATLAALLVGLVCWMVSTRAWRRSGPIV